jgi:prefoldin subunit 5
MIDISDTVTITGVQSLNLDAGEFPNGLVVTVVGSGYVVNKGGIESYDVTAQRFVDIMAEKENLEYRIKELEQIIEALKEQQALNT